MLILEVIVSANSDQSENEATTSLIVPAKEVRIVMHKCSEADKNNFHSKEHMMFKVIKDLNRGPMGFLRG